MSRFDPDVGHPDDEAAHASLDEAWRFQDDHEPEIAPRAPPLMQELFLAADELSAKYPLDPSLSRLEVAVDGLREHYSLPISSCPTCHGTGWQGGNEAFGECDDCRGRGQS